MNLAEVKTMSDVSLNVPAKPDFLHVVRAVVSGVGARQGLSYDAINELSLAASEAAAYLLALPSREGEGSRGRRLCVRLRVGGDIDITVMTDAPVPTWPPATRQTLAWRILAGLVDDVSFVLEEGCPAIRLLMGISADRTEERTEDRNGRGDGQ